MGNIINNFNCFKAIEKIIIQEKDIDNKINLVEFLYTNMVYNHPGIFCSSVIENELLKIAEQIPCPPVQSFDSNSFLHVLTEGYETGGHTRVIERWIENSNLSNKYSIVFTNPKMKNIPLTLKEQVLKRGGNIFYCDANTQRDRASQLRQISQKFEYIIMHIHMDDTVPILAYGTEKFTRPVICYNHSQHTLWLGASVVDLLLETTESIDNFSWKRRGIDNNFYAGLPYYNNKILPSRDKSSAKLEIGLKKDCKLILSIGSAYKYIPVGNLDFCKFTEQILEQTKENVVFLIVGLSEKNQEWEVLKSKYTNRLFLIEFVNNKKLSVYYDAADLYIDSFPVPGGIAFTDAVMKGINAVVLESKFFDTKLKKYFFVSYDKLIERTIDLLYSTQNMFQDIPDKLKKDDMKKWVVNAENIIKKHTKQHRINKIDSSIENQGAIEEYDYFWFSICQNCFSSSKFNISALQRLPLNLAVLIIKTYLEYSDDISKRKAIKQIMVSPDFVDDYSDLTAILFVDTGSGFNEKEHLFCRVDVNNGKFCILFDISSFNNIKQLRFDPVEGYCCRCRIDNVETDGIYTGISSSNAYSVENGMDVFLTIDPQYVLSGDFSKASYIKIEGECIFIKIDEVYQKFDSICRKYKAVINSRTWRYSRKFVKYIHFLSSPIKSFKFIKQNIKNDRIKNMLKFIKCFLKK